MKNIVTLFFAFGISLSVMAQTDPHFTQFYAYPMGLNPGLAGVNGGDFRVSAIYRTQWTQVMTPFTTMGISADVATQKNINFGINILNQTAGNAGYHYQHGYLTIGYGGVRFGEDNNQQLSFGIQVGALARKFDPAGFQFGDQWNSITGYDPSVSSADLLPRTSSSDLDIGAGVSYSDARENRAFRLFGGFSAFHLNRPQDPFVTRSLSQQIPMRFSVHGGVQINVNERIQLTPQLLLMKQGTALEQMIGMSVRMPASATADLLAGINYRINDALAPYLAVGYGQWLFGFSYDVAAGELGKQVPGTSSFELSLTYTGLPSGRPIRYLSCPRL